MRDAGSFCLRPSSTVFVPELPDVTVYVEAIGRRVIGQPLTGYAIRSVFALRTVDPSLDALVGRG
jgi:formamidopyrimidine-DNA glycosylase